MSSMALTTSNCVHHTHRTFPADGRNLKGISLILAILQYKSSIGYHSLKKESHATACAVVVVRPKIQVRTGQVRIERTFLS